MSTCRPDATSCQPRSCTGVGPSNELRNQSRVAGAKRSRDVPTRSSLTGSWRTNKRSLTGWRRLAEAHAMYPFERFNEDAKRSLTLAQEEAERSHHSYIGTEHLLLGLLRVETGTAYRVLTGLGVDIQTVREVIKSVLGRNERILVQSIIPTSRVKKVIELSFEEARRMGDNEVDTAHMLLGLIIEGEGIGVPADHRTANQCICQPHDWYYEEGKQVLAIHTLTRTEDYPADERHQRHDYVEQFVGEVIQTAKRE